MNLLKHGASTTTRSIRRSTTNLSNLDILLNQCNNPNQLNQILGQSITTGLFKNIYTAGKILKAASLSNFIDTSYCNRIFKCIEYSNGFIYNTMMRAYIRRNQPHVVIIMYKDMLCRNAKYLVDDFTCKIVVQSCGACLAEFEGREVHDHVVKMGFEFDAYLVNFLINMYGLCGNVSDARRVFDESTKWDVGSRFDLVSWTSMISGYLRCSLVVKARELFDSMPQKNVISWTAMISSYAQHGQYENSVRLFEKMLVENVKPSEITLVSVISAYTHLGALDQGKWIHDYIKKNGLKIDAILGTALIDMYMKSGCLESAMEVFDQMEQRGVGSWNSLILGLAMNGQVARALETFNEMQKYGVTPDEATFVAVLGACRHMGLVDEGRHYFHSIRLHNIEPTLKHYGCMVDLLGRAGLLIEAEKLINNMPMTPEVETWGALLGACRKYDDKAMGERIGRKLIELKSEQGGHHTLLSNLYASRGNWDNVIDTRKMMQRHGVVKRSGFSMIEADGIVQNSSLAIKYPPVKEIA